MDGTVAITTVAPAVTSTVTVAPAVAKVSSAATFGNVVILLISLGLILLKVLYKYRAKNIVRQGYKLGLIDTANQNCYRYKLARDNTLCYVISIVIANIAIQLAINIGSKMATTERICVLVFCVCILSYLGISLIEGINAVEEIKQNIDNKRHIDLNN